MFHPKDFWLIRGTVPFAYDFYFFVSTNYVWYDVSKFGDPKFNRILYTTIWSLKFIYIVQRCVITYYDYLGISNNLGNI